MNTDINDLEFKKKFKGDELLMWISFQNNQSNLFWYVFFFYAFIGEICDMLYL